MEKLIRNAYRILLHVTILSAIVLILNNHLKISDSETIGWISLSLIVYSLILAFVTNFLNKILRQKKNEALARGERSWQPVNVVEQNNFKAEEEDHRGFLMELKEIREQNNAFLSRIADKFQAVQGLYLENENDLLFIKATYAYKYDEDKDLGIDIHDGFFGAVVKSGKTLVLDNVPEGLLEPFSGLGSSKPACLIFIPVLDEGGIHGIFELATFKKPEDRQLKLAEYLANNLKEISSVGDVRKIKELV